MIGKLMSVLGSGSQEEDEQDVVKGEDMIDNSNSTLDVPDRDRTHRDMIAPTTFIEEDDYVRSGDDYVQTLLILNWPDEPAPMFMEQILYQMPVDTDISIHVSPREKSRAIDEIERDLDKASTKATSGGIKLTSQKARQRELQNTQRVYDTLVDGDANLFELSMYVTVRSENPEDLKLASEEVVRTLRTNSINPEILRKRQRDGMKSASPVSRDIIDYKKSIPSPAVGAMYPFGTTTVRESGGIVQGNHAVNNSPVTVRRFERDNGYNQITAGKIGSGKTFGTMIEILRSKAAHGDDLAIFMLDPLEGFKPVSRLLGGKEILVGGNRRINPMKITETPEEVFSEMPDYNPFSEKQTQVIEFFEMFFAMQGSEGRKLGEARDVLSTAIRETYNRNGITEDPSTHSNQSPTIMELIDTLRDIEQNPTEYAEVDDGEESKIISRIEDQASRLILALGEFEQGGVYHNLAQSGQLELSEEDVVFFNLSQKEGSGGLGLMMYLLLSEVYEQAKQRSQKIMFTIDEAHYIMSDARSLNFLEQAVRHSRHYDLGITFITQTVEEFFSHEKSEAIAQQCSIRKLHKLESGLTDSIMDTLSLNQSHVNFIQNAEPGSEEAGYSEALYGIDEYGYVPIRIYPSEFELDAINSMEDQLEVNG